MPMLTNLKTHLFKTKHPSWVLFVVLGIATIAVLFAAGVFQNGKLATQVGKFEQSTQLQTLSSEDLTQQLLTKTEEWKQAKGKQKADLAKQISDIAQARKTKLLAAMEQNPQQVLDLALSPEQRSQLPPESQPLIEEHIDLTGTLEVLHEDDFENQKSRDFHFLNVNNQRFSLHTSDQFPPLLSSSKVRVTGVKLEDKIAFTTENTLEVLEEATPDTIGEQKTVVILANFQDTVQPDLAKSEVADIVFRQVDDYYREVSYEKMWLAGDIGDVLGWYTLPINKTCDNYLVSKEAIKAADSDVDFSRYGRLIIILSDYCGGGFGTIGKTVRTTNDGSVLLSISWIRSTHVYPYAIGHEFGHNLSLQHASFLSCGEASMCSIQGACSGSINVNCYSEYGDVYDIMGSLRNTGHINAPHKEYLGWFNSSNILEVTESGIYTIEPIETTTLGLKTLKIQRDPADYLYIEYRQPIGEDADLMEIIPGTDVFEGALLHIRAVPALHRTLILDMSPPESNFWLCVTPTLLVGNFFTDPATGTTITVTDRTPTALTVNVTIGTLDSDGDGFSNFNEFHLGTDPLLACPKTATADDEPVDAWPPDFNDDGKVDGSDLFLFAQRFGTQKGVSPPIGKQAYDPRFDLYSLDASENKIDGSDLFVLAQYFGKSCLP